MSHTGDPSGVPISVAAKLGDWLERGRRLATQVGQPDALDGARRLYREIDRRSVRIVVVGGPKSGKSQLIQRYLGLNAAPRATVFATRAALPHEFILEGVSPGEQESVAVDGELPRPLAEAVNVIESAVDDGRAIVFRLARQELAGRKLTVFEAPALDVAEAEVVDVVDRLLGSGDVLVFVIDANAPLRRIERVFLDECQQRGLPIVAAIAKADQIPNEERAAFDQYANRSFSEPTEANLVYVPDADGSAREFTEALARTLAKLDAGSVRARQVAVVFSEALADLLARATAAREQQAQGDIQFRDTVRVRKLAIEGGDLIWQEIQLTLQRRSQKVETSLREHLAANRQSLLETLHYELERSGDIKSWWNRDLPYRLQREIRVCAAQLSGSVNRQIAGDIQWLREELKGRLDHHLPPLLDVVTAVQGKPPELAAQGLADTNVFKIISRIGTGGSAIIAGTLFAASGVGGIALAASIGVGLLSEQVIRSRANRDRETVRVELGTVIATAELQFAAEVSQRLGEAYDRIVRALKTQQLRWQHVQLQALQAFAAGAFDPVIAASASAASEIQALWTEIQDAL